MVNIQITRTKNIKTADKTFHPRIAPIWLYASPEPPAISYAPVYRVHDHHQTPANRMS